jgi:hypothetical protein
MPDNSCMSDENRAFPVILFARPMAGESAAEIVRSIHDRMASAGLSGKSRAILKPLKKSALPKETVIITDEIGRLVTGTICETIQLLFSLVDRGCTIYALGRCEQDPRVKIDQSWLPYLRFLGSELPRTHRSLQIRNGQALSRFRGLTIGRPILAPNIECAVLEALATGLSIRAAEKQLRTQGITVSRSTIGRIARLRKARV